MRPDQEGGTPPQSPWLLGMLMERHPALFRGKLPRDWACWGEAEPNWPALIDSLLFDLEGRGAPEVIAEDDWTADLGEIALALDGVIAAPPPEVLVFDPSAVKVLEATAEGRDNETKARITEIVKKLRATNASKPLAVIPADWPAQLDQMAADFPNFVEFVDFLRRQFALSRCGDGILSFPPVLFDGAPGIGKTELVLSLADLFGTTSMKIDMASAQCGAALSGSDAYWGNSREGQLFETLAFGDQANPIIVLDELDKSAGDDRWSPSSALFQLLEPLTAKAFTDLSVRDVALDASHVLWVATTNEVERLSAPMRQRFTVFTIPTPDAAQTETIAKSIYRRFQRQNAWGKGFPPELMDAVARRLASFPPRQIRTLLQCAFGNAALDGRWVLRPDDVVPIGTTAAHHRMGFLGDDD
jgi:ATP-dependent Lon protease